MGTPCQSGSTHHKMSTLTDAEDKLQKNYKAVIQELSSEQTKSGKQHKSTWKRFDEEFEAHDEEKKMKAVDESEKQQISEIRRKNEEKRKRIKNYPQALEAVIVNYDQRLSEKQEKIHEVSFAIRKQLREMHVVDMIKRKKDTKKNIEMAKKLELKSCEILTKLMVMTTGESSTEPQASPIKKMKQCDVPQQGQEKRLHNLEQKVEHQGQSRKTEASALAMQQKQVAKLKEQQSQTKRKVDKHEVDIASVASNQRKMEVELNQCKKAVNELEDGMDILQTRSGMEPPTDSYSDPVMEASHPTQETTPAV